jgi:hypothetical protein
MQDGTQAGGMRLILSCTGVLVDGVTSVTRERGRDRESPCVLPVLSAPRPCVPLVDVLRPRISTRGCPTVQWGCSYVLTWLAEKRLEPCTGANMAVGEAPLALKKHSWRCGMDAADVPLLP